MRIEISIMLCKDAVVISAEAKSLASWLCVVMMPASKPCPKFNGKPIVGDEAGLSGAYLLSYDDGNPQFVFKPLREEAQKAGEALKSGTVRGESCIKEVAAYLLDHDGFAGVPETRALIADVQLPDRQMMEFGSLQRYIPHDGTCLEFGTSLFDADNVHRIGLLDLRIGNMDRHEGNVLLSKGNDGRLQLFPIDHGYCLPSWRHLEDIYFCWDSWRQASLPFSDATRRYVADLKPLLDVPTLIAIGIRHECIMTYVLCSLFVQRAVAAGLTLSQIAHVMQRPEASKGQSDLEKIVREAAKKSKFENVNLNASTHWNLPVVALFLKEFILRSIDFLSCY